MALGERTRKASRRELIVESKADIDDDRVDEERLAYEVAGRQYEGWTLPSWRLIFPHKLVDLQVHRWSTFSASTLRREVRMLFWFSGLVVVVTAAAVILLLFLYD